MPSGSPRQCPLYLAIDQGGHASRALVIDGQGSIVAAAESLLAARRIGAERVEYSPPELLRSLRQVITRACRQSGIDSGAIRAAGLATQRSNIACWRRDTREPLSAVISWQDRRAQAWLRRFDADRDLIHGITGLFPSAHYGVSKLRWCLDHLTAVRQAASDGTLCCGPMASFLIQQLLDEHPLLCDPVNASRTLLLDIRSRDWSPRLTRLFDLPLNYLPPCTANRADFGTVMAAGCGIPLQIVTGDQSASLFAFGRPRADSAYITLGTGAFIQRPTGDSALSEPQLLTSLVHDDGSQPLYALEGTVNGAGSAIDHYAREWGLSDHERHLAQWLDRHSDPPLFINGFAGPGTPYLERDLPQRFILTTDRQDSPPARMVAIIESIVFLLAINLELMRTRPVALRRIVVGGGLARLDGLCQRLADLCALPVIRPQVQETTSLGLAFLLAGQPEQWHHGEAAVFHPAGNAALHARFRRWHTLLERTLQ